MLAKTNQWRFCYNVAVRFYLIRFTGEGTVECEIFEGKGTFMSRLQVIEKSDAEKLIDELNRDLEHRVSAGQYGACPVDFIASFVKFCHAQSCGKCVPCRVGLLRLSELINSVLDGEATEQTLEDIEKTASSIYYSADCAIGFEAAKMALKGIRGFRDDFEEHVNNGRCANTDHGVPCVQQCPAHVDIPGYIALVHEGRYADAVNLIRKTNPLPATCGLICEHPCEAQCRRNFVDDAINIRGLKRFAVEHEGEIKLPEPMPDTGKSVGVVGGGPAGLTTAYFLRLMGHSVTIHGLTPPIGSTSPIPAAIPLPPGQKIQLDFFARHKGKHILCQRILSQSSLTQSCLSCFPMWFFHKCEARLSPSGEPSVRMACTATHTGFPAGLAGSAIPSTSSPHPDKPHHPGALRKSELLL